MGFGFSSVGLCNEVRAVCARSPVWFRNNVYVSVERVAWPMGGGSIKCKCLPAATARSLSVCNYIDFIAITRVYVRRPHKLTHTHERTLAPLTVCGKKHSPDGSFQLVCFACVKWAIICSVCGCSFVCVHVRVSGGDDTHSIIDIIVNIEAKSLVQEKSSVVIQKGFQLKSRQENCVLNVYVQYVLCCLSTSAQVYRKLLCVLSSRYTQLRQRHSEVVIVFYMYACF